MELIYTKINTIYYEDMTGGIKKETVFKHDKLKVLDAKQYLKEKGIDCNSIIKVVIETVFLDIPRETILKHNTRI